MKGISILFLTVDQICNHKYWNDWRKGHERVIRFYINSKNSIETPNGFIRLPKHVELTETAWGKGSCVIAHQRLLKFSLVNFKEAEWFILVSGDSIPLQPVKELFKRLKTNTSMFDDFKDNVSHVQWGAMNEAFLKWPREKKNWWIDNVAEHGHDQEGSFATLSEKFSKLSHANHVLCRLHAQAFSKAPESVSIDYDSLVDRYAFNVGGADEFIPLNYIRWWRDKNSSKARIMCESIMYQELTDCGLHAKHLTYKPGTDHLFGRKFSRDINFIVANS